MIVGTCRKSRRWHPRYCAPSRTRTIALAIARGSCHKPVMLVSDGVCDAWMRPDRARWNGTGETSEMARASRIVHDLHDANGCIPRSNPAFRALPVVNLRTAGRSNGVFPNARSSASDRGARVLDSRGANDMARWMGSTWRDAAFLSLELGQAAVFHARESSVALAPSAAGHLLRPCAVTAASAGAYARMRIRAPDIRAGGAIA